MVLVSTLATSGWVQARESRGPVTEKPVQGVWMVTGNW